MTKLLSLPAAELLDRFASPDPTPGGGSAAALAGALGAALVSMVCAMPKSRTGAAPERARLDAALAWAREAGQRLRALVEEDARAYDAVVAAYRLPKGTDEEKAARKAAVAAAMVGATEVPLETAEACLVVLKSAEEAVSHGNRAYRRRPRLGGARGGGGERADQCRVAARRGHHRNLQGGRGRRGRPAPSRGARPSLHR